VGAKKEDPWVFFHGQDAMPEGLHIHPSIAAWRRLCGAPCDGLRFASGFAAPTDFPLYLANNATNFALRAADFAFGFPLGLGFRFPLSRHDGSFLSIDR
jgi:hypothetical protein